MITLKADDRPLLQNAKFSYLTANYLSGVTSLVVTSGVDFSADDDYLTYGTLYVLLGEFGSETTEIVQVSNVSINTLTVGATLYAHPIDTKVTILKYNRVIFYRTVDPVFVGSAGNRLTGATGIDIQCDSLLTKYYDVTNTTGYGWFVFYNETTTKATEESNAIPYADFEEYSVKKIFDSFFSLLNNKEKKLISNPDAFRWLNEGYSLIQSELNLVNPNYNVPAEWTFTVTGASDREASLPDTFSDIISVTDADGEDVNYISLSGVPKWDDDASSTNVRYFLRNDYIGISPIPTSSTTYYVYYKSKATTLTSYYDNIDMPDNNFYPLIDHMMYRASTKLEKPNPNKYEDAFKEGIQRMKVVSHKRSNSKDTFDIAPESNV